ncbi:undecaprenyldiphospho-muramoylpentapeptide beta-N-acetylglucosaminyltransferase [Jannaschia seosinensis]|uniref:Undecaprenyldiphospho-muramoylpentapeptide beta-N-acetylglucosaminyltransferase n=1 Tax=Jannaschia seosinensis TaxID=313367 RepID=A0A0M7BBB8_9RHOB|nr:glycosyltransferase [Jannaschia seosinensis]CUH40030.1 undecaprenyldiphospho-muramoylpentapeptide beta-N-acetylglucosaminyltransferase [Jannaschia seosinensis]
MPRSRRRAIVLTALGSLGDLFPVLSVARALEKTGVECRLALPPDNCDMARRWGLPAVPVGPTQAEVCERLNLSPDEVAASIFRDPSPMLNRVMIPMLPQLVAQFGELAQGAACIAGTSFALHAPLAAERAGLPFVPLILQPMMLLSATDGPTGRNLGPVIHSPQSRTGRAWNRFYLAIGRQVLKHRHAGPLRRVRADLDLPPHRGTPLIDPGNPDVPLRLGLWSHTFAQRPADAPPELRVTGFPPAPDGDLTHDVRTWLDAGPPPLVVTLGSIAQGQGGVRFWEEAVRLARAMGLRAVLLHGQVPVPKGDDLLPLSYAAHAPLFPRAAAVIHHGGIGTTAEAVRAGRPQLVCPVGGDQPDNAARLVLLKVAATIPVRRFTAERGMAALRILLDQFDYAHAAEVAEQVGEEDGAAVAARLLESVARSDRPASADPEVSKS